MMFPQLQHWGLRLRLRLGSALLALSALHPGHAAQMQDALQRQVSVPDAPQRIIALSEPDLDALLALGLSPVAASHARGQSSFPAYLQTRLQKQPPAALGPFMQTASEALLLHKPDLILAGSHSDPVQLAQWSRIAPVFVSFKPGEDWQQGLLRIARVLGREAQAQALLQQQQNDITALRGQLQRAGLAGQTVSLARWNAGGMLLMQRDAFAARLLLQLGLQRPPSQQTPGSAHSAPLMREAWGTLEADWLLVGCFGAEGLRALQQAQHSNPLQQLAVVRKQHVLGLDGAVWTGPGGYLAAQSILQDLQRSLLPGAR